MGWIEDSRRLRHSLLAPDGLARLGDAVGEPVEPVRPLHGGVTCSVYEVATPTRRLVLKRFLFDDAAPLEWERLRIATAVPIPTPEPVALDAAGAWFGMPALVAGYLEGEPMYPPAPEVLGRLLAAIHATPVLEPAPAVLLRPAFWATWEQRVPYRPGVVQAIAELQAIAPAEPAVLCHCDFHPGNVIVAAGAVTGVVDWSSARLTAAGLDVGFTRCDLAIEPGGDAPDRFLAAYEAAGGVTVDHLSLWDVLAAARAIEQAEGWVDAWTDTGVPMTAECIRERATAFAAAALSR